MVSSELLRWEWLAAASTAATAVLAGLAELLHARRVRRLAPLAFGPLRRPRGWARAAPLLRVISLAALTWGLTTLMQVEPRRFAPGKDREAARNPKHVLIALDVSPSMRLVDAGSQKKLSRMNRARELMESFFDRVPLDEFRVSVVAFYTGAKPVVVDTSDFEVVRNILGDLPMNYAFETGKTQLFAGLEEAAKVASKWSPGSATLLVLTDGDTVPATGMPRMPESIHGIVVIGVGDADSGTFIDGHNSRQDVPTLRQVAARLGGSFHNGNEFHLPSKLIADATGSEKETVWEKLTRRDYALIACACGAAVFALLPLLLDRFGTRWRVGVPDGRTARAAGPGRDREGRTAPVSPSKATMAAIETRSLAGLREGPP